MALIAVLHAPGSACRRGLRHSRQLTPIPYILSEQFTNCTGLPRHRSLFCLALMIGSGMRLFGKSVQGGEGGRCIEIVLQSSKNWCHIVSSCLGSRLLVEGNAETVECGTRGAESEAW